jgi:hypothetical protein
MLAMLSEKYSIDEGGVATLKSLVLPSPWIVELNGGLPDARFKTNNLLLVGDATLGYSTKSLGAVASGGINYSDLVTSSGENEVDHAYGSLEAWWISGDPTSPVRFEGRLTGGVDYYDTTLCPGGGTCNETVVNATTPLWLDYDSLLLRGTLLAGVRWKAGTVTGQALVGGGGQYETQDSSSFGGGSPNEFSLTSQTNISAQGSARLLVRWRIVPGWVGMRLRGDGTYFTITRDTLAVAISQTGNTSTSHPATEQDQQLELHGRVFLDADVLSFAQFVPAIWGGVDFVSLSGPTNSATSAVPVFGIGIVRGAL